MSYSYNFGLVNRLSKIIVLVDLRTITFDVPPQEILTKDSVTVTVDAVCYFRVFNPIASGKFYLDALFLFIKINNEIFKVINVANAQYSARLLAATTLRNCLGTKTLMEILQDKGLKRI